jgi:amino acid transporter
LVCPQPFCSSRKTHLFPQGTGIFDAPGTIIKDTNSVGLTLIFWFFGSIATVAGTLVFIEYGLTIPRWDLNGQKIFTPRSGGEFNYINYLMKKPKFFASCVYAIPFILVGNAAANALSFASHVAEASGYDILTGTPSQKDMNMVRGIALGTMTAVCILHGIWRRLGIVINNVFAGFKILLLLLIIILGFVALGGKKTFHVTPPASENLSPHNSFAGGAVDSYAMGHSYLEIVFAYGG